jgi:Protein of unknown function (DUF1592)/Protein of unknown function (DUF1588)/Protein of unknown function (DUF1587)/Protein of unknown function (DUF1585)/Protein of unknown function (DUF1595)/Planctomycete cytochrome C
VPLWHNSHTPVTRWFLLLAVPAIAGAIGVAPHAGDAPVPTAFETSIQPFLADHCYDCHDTRHHKGDLNLTRFRSPGDVAADPDTWDKVLQKLRTGEMPPEDEIRPEPEDLALVTGWIDREVQAADLAAPAEPGRVVVRRLNRAEYNNTIRDLVGLDLQPADEFPQDDTGYGFDTIGAVLSLPPVLMEKYLAAAERISRRAIFGPEPMKPMLEKLTLRSRNIVPSPTPLTSYDETGLSLPNAFHVEHRIPVEADYRIHAVAGGTRPAGSEPIELTLWVDGTPVQTRTLDPERSASFSDDQQDFLGKGVDFRVHLTAGVHWLAVAIPHLYEGLPPSYGGPNPSHRPEPPPPTFKPPPYAPADVVARRRKKFEEEHKDTPPANNVRAAYLEVGGPYAQVLGPSATSVRRIFVCGHAKGHHVSSCGRRIVSSLMTRAFRRPVAPAETARYLRLFTDARRRGESFEEGVATALQAILVSPDFLFRLEQDQQNATGPWEISDTELATRLSYFLWSSMPDLELRRLAARHQLRAPGVLEAQVRRMLADRKSHALVQQFGGQWLEVRALESARPDPERFPDFDDYLRISMRRETNLFFESIIREDRSILDFLDARYTFVNARLARHYGIPGVEGPEFRRVALAGTPRAGILMQASVLTVASYATRTSPVLRGKWILDNLLDAPPPAPPPTAPRLDEAAVGTTTSMRQQMEIHRRDPTCAACHRRMDPLGFGLESFDAIGAWRTEDGKFPIDSSGQLPDGRTFHGPGELAKILSTEREAFARALTSKLLTYALGRGLETSDHRTVRTIARRVAADGFRFSSLIIEIAKSVPFQMRQGVPAS